MWNVLPKFALLKLIFLTFSAMFLAALIQIFGSTDLYPDFRISNFSQAFKIATPVSFVFIGIVYVIGKWGWRLLWKVPLLGAVLNKSICPDLNGIWVGHIESNFTDANGNRTKKEVALEIKADFFGFSISLKSLDGYQSSKVVQSELYKDLRTNAFYTSYIYEGDVPIPEASDDRIYDGASKLEVKFDKKIMRLEGTYWTNRAWQRKLNTAGIIKLSKKKNA